MRLGLLTLNSGDDPKANLAETKRYIEHAADEGAQFILTPEVTNCLSASRSHQAEVLRTQSADETLKELQDTAKLRGIWLLIGSLALKSETDARFVNRCFLIAPDGEIVATYDKIHMFDVELSDTETYRESAAYQPGDRAVVAQAEFARIGMTICYDLRFPHLYRALAKAGAHMITVPAAFSATTGRAHWESLLRARAIENGCFIVAPAQCGTHGSGALRQTHGHSMVISPWGEVLFDGGTQIGARVVDIDLNEVEEARRKIPSLQNEQVFMGP